MRLRPVLLATAAAAALGGSLPADAAIYPVCATSLTLAPTGTAASCATNAVPVALRPAQRVMTVEVLSGSVDAVLRCGTYATLPLRVSGPRPVNLAVNSDGACTVTITAAGYDTTAVVTSTFRPAIHS